MEEAPWPLQAAGRVTDCWGEMTMLKRLHISPLHSRFIRLGPDVQRQLRSSWSLLDLRRYVIAAFALLSLSLSAAIIPIVSADTEEAKCGKPPCLTVARGKPADDSSISRKAIGENQEASDKTGDGAPFSISVDGEPLSGAVKPEDDQRRTDLGLENVDIQVKFDGLDVKPVLNVSTTPIKRTYRKGERIDFLGSLNYWAWVSKAEVRIYERHSFEDDAVFAAVPVSPDGSASWAMTGEGKGEFVYVLRVYDSEGRYDQTKPLTLERSIRDLDVVGGREEAPAPGYGEDRTDFRNIPVYGGAVTVYGRNVPEGHGVEALGEDVPVDETGAFVIQRILPPGDHDVDVAVLDAKRDGLEFSRPINIPENDWFYVAMADATVGYRWGSNNIEDIKPGEFDDIYTKGRLAFYLKGKIKGRYLLTASADTKEDEIENLFRGLDSKDPKKFLSRIDPDDYYPVYGDESTAVEDAPTRGKFYVRLERGDSHVMWGNFKTRITGTEFLRNERALYGANAIYRSEKTTEFGERKTEISVFAAQPGTLPQRDVLRGTGGSAYFLKYQDVTIGSETVNLEIRDRVTGRVLERRALRYGHDYEIDYVQGLIILQRPLSSTAGNGDVVGSGALSGNDVFLIVNYEYTPATTDVKGYSYGGRLQQWLGEHVRIGGTGAVEKTGAADQEMVGADVVIRHSERTFVEAEVARTKGPGFGRSSSADGGLTISDTPTAGVAGKAAYAYRIRARVGLEDLTDGKVKGDLEAFYERSEKGFSSYQRQIATTEELWGVKADVELTDRVAVKTGYSEFSDRAGKRDRLLNAEAHIELDNRWTLSPGVKHSLTRNSSSSDDDGSRTDLGVRLTYEPNEETKVYAFGQATIARSGDRRRNDRGGVGAEFQVTEKTSLAGEVSYGSLGWGALAAINYDPTADQHYYIGYRLDPERDGLGSWPYDLNGTDLGGIVAGARHRFNDEWSVFAEDSYDLFGERRSLTQTYGVKYTPDALWTISGGLEMGTIEDDSINSTTGLKNSNFDRTAISLGVGYRGPDGIDGHIKGELRFEDSEDNTRDADSYLIDAGLSLSISDDWKLLASADFVLTDATETARDGRYAEASLGFAYRPVDNDRLNALFKYTFLYDYPGPDQVTVNGTTLGPAQRTHIASVDVSYDLTRMLTIGGKYGVRFGETKDRTGGGGWDDASAQLAIIRADFHVVENWDALIEGRALWTNDAETVDLGLLAAVYRHVGENFKIGVGYNFGNFSDDLSDLTYDDHGVFLNAIGKF
jgi:hypothetical protein